MDPLQEGLDQDSFIACGKLFFHDYADTFDPEAYQPYLDFYHQEISEFGQPVGVPPRQIQSCSHENLREIFQELEKSPHKTKNEITKSLSTQLPSFDDAGWDESLNLVCRIGYLLNARPEDSKMTTPEPALTWEDNVTLDNWIGHQFTKSEWRLTSRESRLHPKFTAAFMVRVCGLQLYFTNCIADHLYLDRRNKLLHVFRHKACIEARLHDAERTPMGDAGSQRGNRACIPPKVLRETVVSLNLLFPSWDSDTVSLLERKGQIFHLFGSSTGPKSLNLTEFVYCRDRLMELYDVVFLSPPASLRQLFLDDRNPQHYWTFLIAVVVLILTVVGTAASIVQAARS